MLFRNSIPYENYPQTNTALVYFLIFLQNKIILSCADPEFIFLSGGSGMSKEYLCLQGGWSLRPIFGNFTMYIKKWNFQRGRGVWSPIDPLPPLDPRMLFQRKFIWHDTKWIKKKKLQKNCTLTIQAVCFNLKREIIKWITSCNLK